MVRTRRTKRDPIPFSRPPSHESHSNPRLRLKDVDSHLGTRPALTTPEGSRGVTGGDRTHPDVKMGSDNTHHSGNILHRGTPLTPSPSGTSTPLTPFRQTEGHGDVAGGWTGGDGGRPETVGSEGHVDGISEEWGWDVGVQVGEPGRQRGWTPTNVDGGEGRR